MSTLLKVLGWLLLILGALFLLMVPFAMFDADADAGAVPGLILIAGFFGAPGALVLRTITKRDAEQALQDQMVGFVRSRDAFNIDELGAHIGKTPGEAQTLLHRDIARYHLPLVLHRASGRYLRLDRLSQSAQVAERCQSCGGALGNQVVFEGEQLDCPYCGVRVSTHAPTPTQAQWGAAEGAWAQPGGGQHPQPHGYPQQHQHPQPPPGYAPPGYAPPPPSPQHQQQGGWGQR